MRNRSGLTFLSLCGDRVMLVRMIESVHQQWLVAEQVTGHAMEDIERLGQGLRNALNLVDRGQPRETLAVLSLQRAEIEALFLAERNT